MNSDYFSSSQMQSLDTMVLVQQGTTVYRVIFALLHLQKASLSLEFAQMQLS